MKRLTYLILFATLTLLACNSQNKYPDLEDGIYAEIITSNGTFVAKLYHDKTPLNVANFVSLAEGTSTMTDSIYKGKPFYNGLTFHRIMKDFMLQGGDPLGSGMGSPGYRFPDQFAEGLIHDRKGLLSMANGGPDSNGSQFFVTLVPTPWLDGRHAIFGEVVIGQDVVDAIGLVEVEKPSNKPIQDVIIQEVNIIRVGSVKEMTMEDALVAHADSEAKAREALKQYADEAKATLDAQLAKAEELPSGLKIAYLTKGEGAEPQPKQTVVLEYEGYFTDGFLFDSSNVELADKFKVTNPDRKARGQYGSMQVPFDPEVGLVAGFKEAMMNMRVGDDIVIYIPYHLGWGEQGGNGIPPATDVIFRLKMVDVLDK
jgi:peptidylprolyl isomerase